MGSEWTEVALTDAYSISSGLSKPAKDFGSGYPFLAFKDVFYNTFVPAELTQLVQSSEKEQAACSIKRGDVFLTRTSETMNELGMSAVALKDYEKATFNGFTKRLRPKAGNGLHPEYVAYFLRSPRFRAEMMAFSTMSTRASLNNDMIGCLKISVPPLEIQRSIASILKTLDDRIELNRQMNSTLEAMAQALFKSWFVDFDPVIDNALAAGHPIPDELADRAERRAQAAQQPSPEQPHTLPTHIRQQFPDRFVFTEEMGWVPEGWAQIKVGDYFQLLGGHPFKSSEYLSTGKYGVVTIRNVQDGIFVEECTNRIEHYPQKMKEHCKLLAGDVLLSLTGNVGRTCIVSDGDYVLNQRVSKIKGISGITDSFGYFFFRQSTMFDKMLTIAKGTAQQNLSPIETMKLTQLLPPCEKAANLSENFDFFFEKMSQMTIQNQVLAALRNTLLPKLLSGQLRIPEAEQLLAEAL